jgi:hypothetical protein
LAKGKLLSIIAVGIAAGVALGVYLSAHDTQSVPPVPSRAPATIPPAAAAPTMPLPQPTSLPSAPSPSPSKDATVPQDPPASTPTAEARQAGRPVALPVRLQISAIGVDTSFEYVGLTADGAMDTPKDPTQVAWYELGPKPGERGNAVIAGHVDWGGKLMPFWGLKDLSPGDTVTVSTADGHKYDFVVEWSKMYSADGAPVETVFGQSSRTEITLITCGGTFDRASHAYLSRLVVRAALQ